MRWLDDEAVRRNLLGLDEVRFAALCNAVLTDTAARAGIGRESLSLNLKTKEPDGGIDARCGNAACTGGLLFPRTDVDFQYKSGRSEKSIPKIASEDILGKPRVVEGLKAGHAFVYLAAWDRGDAASEELADEICRSGLQIDRGQIVFIGGTTLANLLGRTPSLLSEFFGSGDTTVVSLDQWESWPPFQNPFQVDAELDAQVGALRQRIETPGATVRVAGAAGDGKTRLILEAVRGSSLRHSVLYAPQVERVSPALRAHLLHTPDISCTLVVDEVDDADAERLINELSPRPDGVRLVLIGLDASGRAPAETLQVRGLGDDVLAAVIQSIAKGIDPNIAMEIARDCERSPKLAVLIASRIRDEPSLAIQRLLADGPVRSALERYLDLDTSDPRWEAIAACALLMRVGWTGEFEEESKRLFEALGLKVSMARRNVQDLHNRYGIAPDAGRFRYVSPAILADHLAARNLEAWTHEELMRVFQAFNQSMADSFARRARRLSAVLANAATVKEVLLGHQSPFRTLSDLEEGGMSMVLQRIAAAFPAATLSTLEQVIGNATADELRAAHRSRRDLVWALEQLLWPEQTFEGAAHLTLKLAAAENETWGNNATGMWVETFQTVLGRTAAGGPRRVSVIRSAATSTSPEERVLAAKAIRAAFRTSHVSRMGNPPSDVPGMPDQAWRPKTYGEWWESLDAYLGILKTLFTDEASEVRTTAAQVLGEIAGELFQLSGERVSRTWADVAASLVGAAYELRGPVISGIEDACDRWEYRLTETDGNRAELPEGAQEGIRAILSRLDGIKTLLQGEDFQSRFRTILSRSPHRLSRGEDLEAGERKIRDEMRPLAREAISKPSLLDDEWTFVLDEKAWWQPERWCEVLGEEDAGGLFRPIIEQLSMTAIRAVAWLSLYEIGQRRAGHTDISIDQRAGQLIEREMVVQAFDLLLRTGYHASHVSAMKRIFAERLVPAVDVNRLAYSDWALHLESYDALELAREALSAAEYAEDVVPFVESYLRSHGEAVAEFREIVLRILTSAPRPGEDRSAGKSHYEWETLAKRFAAEAPEVIGAAVLDKIMANNGLPDSGLIEVIQRAWEAGEKQSLFETVVAPRILGETVGAWRVRNAVEELPLSEVGVDALMLWVDEDPERRARLLADMLGAPHPPMSDLHAALLQRYSQFGVGGIYEANFSSGSWWGPMSEWLKSRIATAEQLAQDERPVVRDWAASLKSGLSEQLTWAERREAEERIERS